MKTKIELTPVLIVDTQWEGLVRTIQEEFREHGYEMSEEQACHLSRMFDFRGLIDREWWSKFCDHFVPDPDELNQEQQRIYLSSLMSDLEKSPSHDQTNLIENKILAFTSRLSEHPEGWEECCACRSCQEDSL